jgi:hypothetical protein
VETSLVVYWGVCLVDRDRKEAVILGHCLEEVKVVVVAIWVNYLVGVHPET